MKKLILIGTLVCLVLVIGCGKRQIIWEKPGITQDQFNEDNAKCYMFAKQMGMQAATITAVGQNHYGGMYSAIGNGISQGIIQGTNQNESYIECMQLHGYSIQQEVHQTSVEEARANRQEFRIYKNGQWYHVSETGTEYPIPNPY